jgi:DNA repair protein RadC
MAEETATTVPYQPTIREMPVGERPRERLESYGPAALSNAELLAIILRTGVSGQSVLNLSQALLAKHGGLMGLARASFAELCAEHGLGPAKTTQLKAALELGRRLLVESPDARPQVTSPADAANLVLLEMSLLEKEEVRVVILDTRNRVLSIPTIYVGSLNTNVVRVAELFRDAIKHNAAAIIVVHNHPSGDPTPSPEDVHLTEMLVQAGKLMDIEVLDHLIIGQGRFVSLKERGLGFR